MNTNFELKKNVINLNLHNLVRVLYRAQCNTLSRAQIFSQKSIIYYNTCYEYLRIEHIEHKIQASLDPIHLMPAQMVATTDSNTSNEHSENDTEKSANMDFHFTEEISDDPSSHTEWYLQKHPLELSFPIRFEDGMSYEECEQYYCSLYPDRKIRQQGGRAIPQKRIASKLELQQEASGSLRSCLRRSRFDFSNPTTRRRNSPPKRQLRRCVSFSNGSTASQSPSSTLSNSKLSIARSWQSMRQVSDDICVSFKKHVYVVTVYPFHEYPSEIWSSMWHGRKEFARIVKQASREQKREEQQRAATQRQLEEEELLIDWLPESKHTTEYDDLSCARTFEITSCSSDFEGTSASMPLPGWPHAEVESMETIVIN